MRPDQIVKDKKDTAQAPIFFLCDFDLKLHVSFVNKDTKGRSEKEKFTNWVGHGNFL